MFHLTFRQGRRIATLIMLAALLFTPSVWGAAIGGATAISNGASPSEIPLYAAVSADRTEVYHILFDNPTTHVCEPHYYDRTNGLAYVNISWKIADSITSYSVKEDIYHSADYSGTAPESYDYMASPPREMVSSLHAVSANCTDRTRTYVIRLYDTSTKSPTLLAEQPILIHGEYNNGDDKGLRANVPDNVDYLSEPQIPGSNIQWCDPSNTHWISPTNQFGYYRAVQSFQQVRDTLVPSSTGRIRALNKRPAVYYIINAFNYRYNETGADNLRASCIQTKVSRLLDVAEGADVPLDLHIGFSPALAAERPDLWNWWIHPTDITPQWVQNYQTSTGESDYISYVKGIPQLASSTNVDWKNTGNPGDTTNPMKVQYFSWAGSVAYNAPPLVLTSPAVQAAITDVLVSKIAPVMSVKMASWHANHKDYLLAGISTGLEDGYQHQLCRDASDPATLCLSGRGANEVVPYLYGYMAWMQSGCTGGVPCSTPTGDRITTLKQTLQLYQQSVAQVIYTRLGVPRYKIHTHILCTPNTVDFTATAFNEFSRFGASFYPDANGNCAAISTSSGWLAKNNNDRWTMAEIGPDNIVSVAIPRVTNTNYPGNELISVPGIMGDNDLTAAQNYLTSNQWVTTTRTYGGALNVNPSSMAVMPGSNNRISYALWVSANTPANPGSYAAIMRIWVDKHSDGTFDDPPNDYGGIYAGNFLSLGMNGITIECGEVSRTYVFELLTGVNYSHVQDIKTIKVYDTCDRAVGK